MKAEYEDLKMELWLRNREKMYWETKDGRKIPLKEMTDTHLVNTIAYLDRRYDEYERYLDGIDLLDFDER